MADLYPIRPITDSEFAVYHAVGQHAFHNGPPREADLPLIGRLFGADRSLAAFDPALPASAGPGGTAGAHTFRMSVPGGLLPTAGVTYGAVLPTYRRRGTLGCMAAMKITLSAAMRARDVSRPRPGQLAEAAAREEPAARAGPAAAEPGATPAAEGTAQPHTRRRRRRTR